MIGFLAKACAPCADPQPVIGAPARQSCVRSPETPFARAPELSLSAMHLLACRLIAHSGKPLAVGVVAGLVGALICFAATAASAEGPLKFVGSQLEPIKWADLAGWTADDH